MNKQLMNVDEFIYNARKPFEEIDRNLELAIEMIEYGEPENAIDLLKIMRREIGGE
jgi:hypothetical protein